MAIDVSGVLSAYKKTGGIMDDADASASVPSAGGGQGFGSMLKSFLGDTTSALKDSEKAATSSVTGTGKADLASIATAIDNAEVLLTEITTIRDKAITAYQTITSSAI